MTPDSPDSRAHRPFAARQAHKGWGWGLTIFGAIGTLALFDSSGVIITLGRVVFGVYLLRGPDPYSITGNESQQQIQARAAAIAIERATRALADAQGGGKTVVAYRNLGDTINRFHPQDAPQKFSGILRSLSFNSQRLKSPGIGAVFSASGGVVEIFQEWIIYGQEAYDIDASTRGSVYVDGSLQTVVVPVQGNRLENRTVDMRTATLQFASTSWSMSVPIHPNQASEARRLVTQLTAIIEQRRPKAVTSADIQAMVNTILNRAGQPPAEKLKQLSNLRYERLLSDEEFEAAKARILGI